MNNISTINSNINNSEYNNKLALECSYLINEIKRKNSTFLLPIYINNRKLYLQNKLISNKISNCYSKDKYKNNIKHFISRNMRNNNLHKNKSEENIFFKKYPINNKNNSISLKSICVLPKVKPKNNYLLFRKIITRNKINYNQKNQSVDDNNILNKNNNKFLGLENYMKERFYSDTEKKLKNNLKTIYFRNDEKIKNKIIFLKKFGIFWKRLIQYCIPIINLKKYQIDYNNRRHNNIDDDYYNNKDDNKENINFKKIENNRYNKSAYKSLSLPKLNSSKIKVHIRNNSQNKKFKKNNSAS